jgi:hypothetical protein
MRRTGSLPIFVTLRHYDGRHFLFALNALPSAS